jgi:hypothetical protein
MAVYEHFILQEAGYVPCIPLTRISTETSLFNWSKESVHKRMYYHGPYTKGNLLLVYSATFNNILVLLWRSVLLVEETGVPGENHIPVARH